MNEHVAEAEAIDPATDPVLAPHYAKHKGKPPLGSAAAAPASLDAQLAGVEGRHAPLAEQVAKAEKPETDEELGYFNAAMRRIYSDPKNGLPTLEDREKLVAEEAALERQAAREASEPKDEEAMSTDELLGIERHAPTAYRPPAAPEGHEWDAQILAPAQQLASEWAMPPAMFHELAGALAKGLQAPPLSRVERAEVEEDAEARLRAKWGAQMEGKLARITQVLSQHPALLDAVQASGLGADAHWLLQLDGLIERGLRYNRLRKARGR